MIVAITPNQWAALVEVTESAAGIARLEAANGVDLSDEESRYDLRVEITDLLAGWFAARSTAAVAVALDQARVLWAPYQTMREAAEEADEPPLQTIEQPGVGSVVSAESPIRWDDLDPLMFPASDLGADTYTTLTELAGVDDNEYAALVESGVLSAGDGRDV
jgi:2-methylfumaryl-CoA isomerase